MDEKLKRKTEAEIRKKRLASALKVNVQKRKEQAEARRKSDLPEDKKDYSPSEEPST